MFHTNCERISGHCLEDTKIIRKLTVKIRNNQPGYRCYYSPPGSEIAKQLSTMTISRVILHKDPPVTGIFCE